MDRTERKEKFIELAKLVEKAGGKYASYLLDPTNSDIMDEISKLETEGDMIEDTLNQYYTTQRNIPYLSLDRAKLLALMDEILDQILLGARSIEAFGGALSDDFKTRATILSEKITLITSKLAEGVIVIYDDFVQAAEICKNIEKIRDEATSAIFHLEREYFDDQDEWKPFIAASRISKRSSGIVNATKAASEMLQLMSMKYL